MLIHKMVSMCDMSQQAYDEPVNGAAVLAQGATGRWCEVMHIGPENKARCVAAGQTVLTYEQACAKVLALGPHSTVDF